MSKKKAKQQPQDEQLQNEATEAEVDEKVAVEPQENAETPAAQSADADTPLPEPQDGEYSPEEVQQLVDEIVATPKRAHVWEVDFLRGFMILFVVWDHFMWDVCDGGLISSYNTKMFQWLYTLSLNYIGGSLREVTHDAFVTMFVLTSGVSCSFSRNNGKRALKMCAVAILFSVVTYALSATLNGNFTIYFNVIHVIALSVLFWTAIEWLWTKCVKDWQKNIFGVIMFAVTMTALVVGYCAKYMGVHWTNLLFGESAWRSATIKKFSSNVIDYLSFLPDFGWFLVGAFLGRIIYREKKSIFPSVNPKFVSPVTFFGRFSMWVYFISQVIMYGTIYLLHIIFPIL